MSYLKLFDLTQQKTHKIQCQGDKRKRFRRPLSRERRILTTEAIQAIQALKRAHKRISPHHNEQQLVDHVCITKFSRLLKTDLLAVLAELQRQNEFELAIQVFDLVRKELWYKPDLYLYADMVLMLGKNKLIHQVELLFSQMKEEGLEPNTRVCTELLCAYTEAGMTEKAIEIYEMMKQHSGCKPNELTFTILVSSLEKVGEKDVANLIRRDAVEHLNHPKKFLESLIDKQITH
ncbi:hypothetical protein SUGI_0742840 [Cryptomeria japonica]|nr:hypothetical protein SUGI_0742840 [Cryptomeria japonica]